MLSGPIKNQNIRTMKNATWNCSGERAALLAGEGDDCKCADCKRFFPSATLIPLAHGDVCEDCNENRQDAGLDYPELRAPRCVETEIVRVTTDRIALDALADEMLRRERLGGAS